MLQECPELLRLVLGRHVIGLFLLDGERLGRVLHFAVQRCNNGTLHIQAHRPCGYINIRAFHLGFPFQAHPVRIVERLQCPGVQPPEQIVRDTDGQCEGKELFVDKLGECA